MPANIGKYFEKKVAEALKEYQQAKPVMYYRFPDATSARNAMTSQPADHLIVSAKGACIIEEKASEVHESLRSGLSSLFSKKQAAMHTKWLRAGQPTRILFYSAISGNVEVWDGEPVSKARAEGRRLDKFVEPIAVFPLSNLSTQFINNEVLT